MCQPGAWRRCPSSRETRVSLSSFGRNSIGMYTDRGIFLHELERLLLQCLKDTVDAGGVTRKAVTRSQNTETKGVFRCPDVVFLRGGGLSPWTFARQRLRPGCGQSSTCIVVINALLPRNHCLKSQQKHSRNTEKECKGAVPSLDGCLLMLVLFPLFFFCVVTYFGMLFLLFRRSRTRQTQVLLLPTFPFPLLIPGCVNLEITETMKHLGTSRPSRLFDIISLIVRLSGVSLEYVRLFLYLVTGGLAQVVRVLPTFVAYF